MILTFIGLVFTTGKKAAARIIACLQRVIRSTCIYLSALLLAFLLHERFPCVVRPPPK